jgi:hypothetical protein
MGSSCSLGQLDIYLNGLWLSALLHPVEDSDRNFPQWFLAYTGSFCAEDTDFWMGVPTAFCEIGMFTLELKIKTLLFWTFILVDTFFFVESIWTVLCLDLVLKSLCLLALDEQNQWQ